MVACGDVRGGRGRRKGGDATVVSGKVVYGIAV